MKAIIPWFAKNGVAANLLMLSIIVGGLLTAPQVRQEIFPEIPLNTITVTVVYPGASPEEVEEGISVRIEEAVYGISDIKRITSTSSEGVGSVAIELLDGADAQKALDDVKSAVDGVDTFPEDAEEPDVQELTIESQVINVSVSGPADERTLRRLGDRVRDEIAALPGITQVEFVSVRDYEIAIELSEEALRRYRISFDDVVGAVRRSSLDLPGGSIKTSGGEILLRTKGQAYGWEEFEQLILLTRPDGTRVTLGDVAVIRDGFEETDQRSRFDGHPSVMMAVYRVGDQSALDVADAVKAYVADARVGMPEGIQLTTWQDYSSYLRGRLDLLIRNGRAGLLLVFAVLALFLRFRLAMWVAVGIGVAFLGSVMLMPVLGVSVNLISLFAFIVVLGIVVDDAIVVAENIYRVQRRGTPGIEGSIRGAQEVSTPVIFAILTTVTAFLPLLGVPGTNGQIFRVIPLIVIPTLLFSLIESQLVLPHHLSHQSAEKKGRPRGLFGRVADAWRRFQDRFATGLETFVEKRYVPSLDFALRWRYVTNAAFIALLIVTVGLVAGGWVRFVFFPDVEADVVVAELTMPLGTPVAITGAAVERLESAAMELRRDLDGEELAREESVFRHMLTAVGEQPYRAAEAQSGPGGRPASFVGSHLGEVTIELAPSEARRLSSREIADRWRQMTGPIPDVVELSFNSSLFNAGAPIGIQLAGADVPRLIEASEALKERLAGYEGVTEITDDYRAGKEELKLALRPEGEVLGITVADLARQVRQGFYGEEAQRVQRGRDDVKVMVRYPESDRRSVSDLERMRIRTPDGREVPFGAVATVEYGRGYASIRRVDRMRTIDVTADVNPAVANANEIIADLEASFLPDLERRYDGVNVRFEGQQREQRETMSGLGRGFLGALMGIFVLMAIPFRSYVQTLIIMSAIPFGLIGAIWGHLIMGMNLSMLSGFGIVALTGVVVNDNLVLVDYINRRRREGAPLLDAVRTAGGARFRPILLTSLTTFAGLLPMLLEKSVQAQFLIPMAISLAFGIMFATFISLILVPSSYVILEDVRRLTARLLGRSNEPLPATPAESGG